MNTRPIFYIFQTNLKATGFSIWVRVLILLGQPSAKRTRYAALCEYTLLLTADNLSYNATFHCQVTDRNLGQLH